MAWNSRQNSRGNNSEEENSNINREILVNNCDLMGEILKGFTWKEFIRCSLVSKTWHHFIQEILSPHLRKPSGLIIQKSLFDKYHYIPLANQEKVPEFDTDRMNSYELTTIFQSCNGFLLLQYCVRDEECNAMWQYCVLNVTTGKFDLLGDLGGRSCISSINLVRDPCGSCNYKVVVIGPVQGPAHELKAAGFYKIRVYSSASFRGGSEKWTSHVIVGPFDSSSRERFRVGTSWKNNIIWINHVPKMPSFCYNVDTEEFREIAPTPMQHPWKHDSVILSESGGHLHFIELQRRFTSEFDVFELEDDFSGWFLKYHVNLDDQEVLFDHPRKLPCFLSLVRGIRGDDVSLIFYIPGHIISYDLKTKTSLKICEFEVDIDKLHCFLRMGHTLIHHYASPAFFIDSSNSRTQN